MTASRQAEQTEAKDIATAREATANLLARLAEHHDYRVQRPIAAVNVEAQPNEVQGETAPAAPEPVLIPPPPERLWFSILPADATRLQKINSIVARHFKVSVADLKSKHRTLGIVRPRQVAMYLGYTVAKRSYPAIGRELGDRDHTTVMSGVRRVRALMASDPDFAECVDTLAAGVAI